MSLRLRYNAPVSLTFALICFAVLLLNQLLAHTLIANAFSAPGRGAFDFGSLMSYVRLFSYTLGHASWEHLMGNLAFLLLLGPILEEKYGSGSLALMMLITAVATAVINMLISSSGLVGASGIVFMFILLSSFTRTGKGEIPLTFVFIVLLFMTKEVVASFQHNNISELAHILGGVCGAAFGFLMKRG
jgi:rhomboid protease GluP